MSDHTRKPPTSANSTGINWAAVRAKLAFLVAGRNIYLTAITLWFVFPLLLLTAPLILAWFGMYVLARRTSWPVAITVTVLVVTALITIT